MTKRDELLELRTQIDTLTESLDEKMNQLVARAKRLSEVWGCKIEYYLTQSSVDECGIYYQFGDSYDDYRESVLLPWEYAEMTDQEVDAYVAMIETEIERKRQVSLSPEQKRRKILYESLKREFDPVYA